MSRSLTISQGLNFFGAPNWRTRAVAASIVAFFAGLLVIVLASVTDMNDAFATVPWYWCLGIATGAAAVGAGATGIMAGRGARAGRLEARDQTKLRAILSGMVEGLIVVDGDGRVQFFNKAAWRVLGCDPSALRQAKVSDVPQCECLVPIVADARTATKRLYREVAIGSDAGERTIEVRAALMDGTESDDIIVVLHDVSELRRLERVRSDFVANVSHELKTPLTSIKGYVETLLDGALHDNKYNVRFLEIIGENVTRLTNLVHDLLDLASIEAKDGTVVVSPHDWRPIVEAALARHAVETSQKGLECRFESDTTDKGVLVAGHGESMTQILENLLDNAIKYTPAPGTVTVRAWREGDFGCLSVEDTGVGIPSDELDRVFERFYRVDKARSREVGGTGLGLSIVKHLVSSLKGEVHVTSQVGQGTRFTVYLPVAAE